MSLWSQSLSYCLDDCGNDKEKQAKCILKHLSMPVPRSWWEHSLNKGRIDSSFINILQDFHRELIKIPELSKRIDFALLIALGFIDEQMEEKGDKYGTVDSQHSIDDYILKANKILSKRPDLIKLAKKITKKNK